MFASAVNAPSVPPVIRASLIDNEIWSLAVTLAPTWNTPPPVVTVAAVAAVIAGTLAPTAVVVSLAVDSVLLRTSSTDHTPLPRSRTLAVTPPVKPALPDERGVDVLLELGLVRRGGRVGTGHDRDGHRQARGRTGVEHEGEGRGARVADGETGRGNRRLTLRACGLGAEAAVEEVRVTERRGVRDAVDLVAELHDLVLGGLAGGRVRRAGVGRLDDEVADALQHRLHRRERAFCGLHDRDAVLCVAGGLLETGDL